MTSLFWHGAAIVFAHIYWFMHRTAKINLPGLGWLMRRIGRDLVLETHGVKSYMYHPIAGSNAMHIIGGWNEPETHTFVDGVLKGHGGGVTFIDVGANIGEMAIDFARNPAIAEVFAFEPVPSCFHALSMAKEVNRASNLHLRKCAVSDVVGTAKFVTSTTNPSSGGMTGSGNAEIEVPTTTLDAEFPVSVGESIILLDIEGAEYAALQGGMNLINRDQPLIIFEYNDVSRKYFNLEQVRVLLGPDYEFFRLRTSDGLLDQSLDDTWNVVAVPQQSPWSERCKRLSYAAEP
jgi:FkbM family methyltransferase